MSEAAQCVTRRDLGRGGGVDAPLTDLFAGEVALGVEANDEFTPGPDATNTDRCDARLPGQGALWCAQPAPWASMGLDTFTVACGVGPVRHVGINTDVAHPRGSQASRAVSYVEVELVHTDAKGVAAFVTQAFQECADGSAAQMEGLSSVIGAVLSGAGGTHDADTVAFLTPERVAWVILDGRPWTPVERAQALGAIARHLRQT